MENIFICNDQCQILPILLVFGLIGSTLSITVYSLILNVYLQIIKKFPRMIPYKWITLSLWASLAFLISIFSTAFYLLGMEPIELEIPFLAFAIAGLVIILFTIIIFLINSKRGNKINYIWITITAALALLISIFSTAFYLLGMKPIELEIPFLDFTIAALSIGLVIILFTIITFLINSKKVIILIRTGHFDP